MYRRPLLKQLVARLREPRRFIQVLSGPRQVGKTTLARQALDDLSVPSHYASADEPTLQDRTWLALDNNLAENAIRPFVVGRKN